MSKTLFSLILLLSVNGFAQSKSSTTSTELSTVQPAITDNISVLLDLSRSSNQFKTEEADAEQSVDLALTLSKKFASENKLAVVATVSHNETGFEDTLLGDTTVSYTLKAKELNRDNNMIYSARAVLPTSKASQEDSQLQIAGSLRALLSTEKQLLGKPVSISSFVDGMKYNHRFIRDGDGEGLISYRVRIYTGASVSLTEKISIGVEGYYQAGRTYQDALKTGFLLAEEISYTPKKDGASVYLAHTNNGNALGPNGEDSNMRLSVAPLPFLALGYALPSKLLAKKDNGVRDSAFLTKN